MAWDSLCVRKQFLASKRRSHPMSDENCALIEQGNKPVTMHMAQPEQVTPRCSAQSRADKAA
jgi:hypothetical protein